MILLSDIYAAIDKQGAKMFVYPIDFTPAATIEYGVSYAVFFDPSRCINMAAAKHCLAHECGHCATGATHRLSSRWDIISKHEYKANRWAIENFLPYDTLTAAMQTGLTEPWQLADYFDMPQPFIEAAIEHYAVHKEKNFAETT